MPSLTLNDRKTPSCWPAESTQWVPSAANRLLGSCKRARVLPAPCSLSKVSGSLGNAVSSRAVGELHLSQPRAQHPATSSRAHGPPSGSPSVQDPPRVVGRVSLRAVVGSVRRPSSPCQGRCHDPWRSVLTVPLPPGAPHASRGLGGARVPEEATEGADATSPLGVHGFSAPASRTPGIWKDRAASPAPDVSLLYQRRAPGSPSLLEPDPRSVPLPPVVPVITGLFERGHCRTGPICRVLATPASPARKLCV